MVDGAEAWSLTVLWATELCGAPRRTISSSRSRTEAAPAAMGLQH